MEFSLNGILTIIGVAFAASFLKGITGTGLGTIVVSFASLIIGVKEAVVLAALLSFYSGVGMLRYGPVSICSRYYLGTASSLILGTIAGAQLLKAAPVPLVEAGVGAMLIIVGTIFVFNINQLESSQLAESPPKFPSMADLVVSCLAGLLTGITGISLPLLLFHFGRYLSKYAFRHLIVLLFIPSAFVQIITFGINGLLSSRLFLGSLLVIPVLFIGVTAGNRVLQRLSERHFRLGLGIFLYCIAVKLFFS